MCRMYASLGRAGPPPEELRAFRGLCDRGCGGPHGDGWGLVGYAEQGRPQLLVKSLAPASLDPAFEPAAAQASRFPAVLAHFRKASSGATTLDHTHPFVEGPWAFAHNGTVRSGYAEKLAPGTGWNDSRVLFARFRHFLRDDPVEGLRAMVREVRDGGYAYSSITTMLTDGATLWAARNVRERPEEYALHWLPARDRVVLCQERILPGGWAELPQGHLAIVRPGGVELARL